MDCLLEMVLSSHTCWEDDRRHKWSGLGAGGGRRICKARCRVGCGFGEKCGLKNCVTIENSGADLVSQL